MNECNEKINVEKQYAAFHPVKIMTERVGERVLGRKYRNETIMSLVTDSMFFIPGRHADEY